MRKNLKKNHAQWLSLMLSAAMIVTTPGLPSGLSTPETHGVSLYKMNSAAAAKTTAGSYKKGSFCNKDSFNRNRNGCQLCSR